MSSQNDGIQRINISQDRAECQGCGANILDIANFKYNGTTVNDPTHREEHCICKHCGNEFIIWYDIFDEEGHIHQRIFSGDANDPAYNWQEILTEEQKIKIAEHLKDCPICNDRLADELLLDAWFASYIHRNKTP